MPKLKQPDKKVNNKILNDFLNSYSAVSIQAMINTLETSEGWNLFKTYCQMVQRQYELDALRFIQDKEQSQSAAFAAGFAKACNSMSEDFIEGIRKTAFGVSEVIETIRPEE